MRNKKKISVSPINISEKKLTGPGQAEISTGRAGLGKKIAGPGRAEKARPRAGPLIFRPVQVLALMLFYSNLCLANVFNLKHPSTH